MNFVNRELMMNRLAQSRETLRSGGEFGKDKTKFKLDKLGDISRKGFFHKDDIEKLFGSAFIDGLKNSVKSEINPLLKEKINFAIVKKGGAYDLEPYLDFPK